MANYTTNVAVDFLLPGRFYNAGALSVISMDPLLLVVKTPSGNVQHYFGSFNFTYSGGYQCLSWPNSSLTSITTNAANGAVLESLTGIAVSGNLYESYALANNSTGLNTYIFRGNDIITGSNFSDVLCGYAGNDLLNGRAGADTLIGGLGNDIYVVDNVGDTVSETSALVTEIDTVRASASFRLGSNLENLFLTGIGTINGTGNALNNTLIGNTSANILDGGIGNDTLKGMDGNDTLRGGDGNDVLVGGWGIDTFAGGNGNDTYYVDQPINSVLDVSSNGMNWLTQGQKWTFSEGSWDASMYDHTGDGVVDAIVVRYVAGLQDFTLVITSDGLGRNLAVGAYPNASSTMGAPGGAHLSFWMNGRSVTGNTTGSFTIHSLTVDYAGPTPVLQELSVTFSQSDYWSPTNGSLHYKISATSPIERVTELANQGSDHVISSVSYTLSPNIENLTLNGTAINGTGNNLNNIITGNGFDNVLSGGTGNDTLNGGFGNDTLNGGPGVDTMRGGAGIDTYVVDNPLDIVIDIAGDLVSPESDLVISSASYVLSANVEKLTLSGGAAINGTGNNLNNVLTGNAANNVLDGGLGADTMRGGLGDDTYVVDNSFDVVGEAAGQGIDIIKSSVSFDMLARFALVENLTLTGNAAINGTGNLLANILTGNDANNVLNGSYGADTLTGNLGNDTFVFTNTFDSTIDTITDFTTGDLIRLNVSVPIVANFSGLLGTGGNGSGNLAAGEFVSGVGAAANAANAQILYDTTTGVLSFDADGIGVNAAVAFVQLAGIPVLATSDFVLA